MAINLNAQVAAKRFTAHHTLDDANNQVIPRIINVAAITAVDVTSLLDGQIIVARGRSIAGDGGGGTFTYSATSTATADGGIVIAPSVGAGRLLREGYASTGFKGELSVLAFGPDASGLVGASARIQAAIEACTDIVIPAGTYLLDAPLVPRSGRTIRCLKGVVFVQAASAAIDNPKSQLLSKFSITGRPTFQYAASPARKLHCALELRAHEYCRIEADFTGYSDQIIHRTEPDYSSATSVKHNVYDYTADTCGVTFWEAGRETNQTRVPGTGAIVTASTTFNVTWPGDLLVVAVEEATGMPRRMVLGVDYTITSGAAGSSAPATIQTVAAVATTDYLMLYPAHTTTPFNPITNNLYRAKTSNFRRAHSLAYRFTDASRHEGYARVSRDNGTHFAWNSFGTRNAETDYLDLAGFVCGQSAGVSDSNTVKIFSFGPGVNRSGGSCQIDSSYEGGISAVNDAAEVAMTGTVSINAASATVTGVGTKFTTELQTVSATRDRLKLPDGTELVIQSIQSDTSLTLTAVAGATYSGAVNKSNPSDDVSYVIDVSEIGTGGAGRGGRVQRKSGQLAVGTATILATNTAVTVRYPWRLNRAPKKEEILLTSQSSIGTRTISVGSVGVASFIINMSSTHTVDVSISYRIELLDF